MTKIYVHFLVWNDRIYLPDLFESFEKQTYSEFTVRILDNGSTDDTLKYLQTYYPKTIVGRNVKNLGFAPGFNQLIKFSIEHRIDEDEDPYFLLMNSDMILDENCIAEMVKVLDENTDVGAVQPKLYRAFGENTGNEVLEETVKSDILDSTGMNVGKDWRMSDRGAGELDKGQYDNKLGLFGPTGTIGLYRLSVIQKVMLNDEFYDGEFFAYREDCDLAWRLQKLGIITKFAPQAIAWHYRGMYGAEKQTWLDRIKNRRNQRPFFAALSTRNQLLVLLKNLSFADFIRSAPQLIFGEGARVLYGFIFEKQTRGRLLSIWRLERRALKDRKLITETQIKSNAEIRKYVRNS